MTLERHNFCLAATEGNWEVRISPETHYGYFENARYGNGGGLWFELNRLVDFDGVPELPRGVIRAIESLQFYVSEEFYE